MANTVIQLKKSSTPSAQPGSLANGELAINYADGKLFYKDSSGLIQQISGGGNTFSTINAAGTLVVSDLQNDILTLEQGNNIIITGDTINDKITVAADLTAANAWSNTKLSNGTVTLAGALTTTGQIYANSQITIYPVGGDEGGEIQLFGPGSYPDWSIDSYQDQLRFFTVNTGIQKVNFFNAGGGSVKLGVNTGNPQYELDVSGDVNVSGKFRINGAELAGGIADLTPANNYTNTSVTAANNYAGVMANSANAYVNVSTSAANNWANTKLSNTSGVVFDGNLTISTDLTIGNNISNVSSIIFNTSTNRTPATPGELTWSQDDSTLRFDMDSPSNVIGHIGQDQFYYVKNQTGLTITKGTVVRFAGTLGSSGRLLVAPAIANNSYPSKYVIGVAAAAINNGDDGFVLAQGKLREIDTSAFSEGDILYVSSSTPGAFSNTMPTAPNNKITLAAVIKSDNTQGTIEVRLTLGSKLNEDEMVELNGLTNGDVLSYVTANGRFENKNTLVSVYGVANAGFDKANSANVLAYNTGIGANSYADVVGLSSNNYAGVMANASNAYAASLTPDLSPAFNKANGAYTVANAAYDKANTSGANSFTTFAVSGQTSITATSSTDTINFASNNGINIQTDSTTKTVYISQATTIDYGLITGSVTGTTDYGSIA